MKLRYFGDGVQTMKARLPEKIFDSPFVDRLFCFSHDFVQWIHSARTRLHGQPRETSGTERSMTLALKTPLFRGEYSHLSAHFRMRMPVYDVGEPRGVTRLASRFTRRNGCF
jgi:hypothetical protein